MKFKMLTMTEEVNPMQLEENLNQIAKLFRKNRWNCKAYLRENPNIEFFGSPLFSGRSSTYHAYGYYIIKSRKTKRHPKDMPILVQTMIDNYFQEKFGFRAREYGTFTTGSSNQASEYGEVYVLYPIGPFRYVWSKKIHDLYERYQFHHDTKKKHSPSFLDLINDSQYTDKNLADAIASNNEIVVVADRILAIDYRDMFLPMIENKQLQDKFIKILKGEI